MKSKLKVLVVDDSAVVRQTIADVLQSDSDIGEVVCCSDPFVAADRMRSFMPDVITLDVEMPRMDGITFLKKIMTQHPIPVVMCSSLTEENSDTALKALEYGAIEIIQKPRMGTKTFLEESKVLICDAVKAAAKVSVKRLTPRTPISPKLTADAVIPPSKSHAMLKTTEKVILVGASTGGTEALTVFLQGLPVDSPGVVIVQHMPENFTLSFANRLDTICGLSVKQAEFGDTVLPGRVLLAPGNKHLLIKRSGARYYVETKEGPLVSRHRPSVDVLFRSGARYVGNNAVGVILTGMGDDGARGMKELKDAGAFNFAQDEKSSVVFGMPKMAIDHGGVDRILPLKDIPAAVTHFCRQNS
ncbi:response regulator receiver modulated CheB methylesterase [Denitrovibrio acetiphilus DSM 12809]|uniref:Protein-glutamate methylesterase/protein-glutamine glutaminase n=1 Tax=Denitrovibrio acetiphilus (strain DSM 12809 / NBRC 114555 / N2460) TaxID=522772 RepID=D4H200_DENA2|nr:chemotaxis response regulator protein-glutamate methylesterase [Denitrovibrio acetiphilus]ADD66977.1 response regulator receiver modulated CheB methylesterase [Denitrovibrio acetiphilus DSM 12809]